MKTINLFFSLSLSVSGITACILSGANLFGIGLPRSLTLGIGLIDLMVLPILVYTTVKKLKNKQ